MEDVGAAVVAGFKTPPALLSGKERLDFVAPAIQPLAVMDWFLAAATGGMQGGMPCWDSILRILSLSYLALPLTQVESQGTTFAVTDPMELAGHAPLC